MERIVIKKNLLLILYRYIFIYKYISILFIIVNLKMEAQGGVAKCL